MSKIYVTTGAVVNGAESLKRYMNDIKKTPMLSREDEKAAAESKNINLLVEANLRFAAQVAKQYQGMGLELEDLVSFANLGLFEAAQRFDPSKKVKFITFAVWYIRAELTKALNDLARTVRIPSHRTSTEEYSTVSTSMRIGEEEDSETFADRYLAAENGATGLDIEDLQAAIQSALDQLKPTEAVAVKMFYGIGIPYPRCVEEIGSQLGVSGERARQLVRAGEANLKKLADIDLLTEYL